jgi:hypothetical protein
VAIDLGVGDSIIGVVLSSLLVFSIKFLSAPRDIL